ncbi:hypothetical protein BI355_1086 [Companilactobacillus crustorum]|nr:hypothetical protein BI355_1086 [Companilactobacillus crustorum]
MFNTVISLNQIVKKFGKQTVLRDVNFQVPSGRIIGLIGPSGAGKSTIIKIILGMETPDSGQTRIFNQIMPKS